MVGYLYSAPARRTRTTTCASRACPREDLDAKLDGVEQIRGVGGRRATTPSDELKARLQKEIDGGGERAALPQAGERHVPGGGRRRGRRGAAGGDVRPAAGRACCSRTTSAPSTRCVLKLRAHGAARGRGRRRIGAAAARTSSTKMGEEQRLMPHGRVAQDDARRRTRRTSPATCRRWTRTPCSPLLDVLETIELPENRALLCDVLAASRRSCRSRSCSRLESDRPQTVRDMVYILEKSKHPDAAEVVRAGAEEQEPGGEAGGDEHHRPRAAPARRAS